MSQRTIKNLVYQFMWTFSMDKSQRVKFAAFQILEINE